MFIFYTDNYIRKSLAVVLTLPLILTLVACEVLQPQTSVEDEAILAKYENIPLKKLLNDLQQAFQKAKDETIYFYSPTNYRTAKTSIQTARAYARDPERKTLVLKNIHRADTAIKDGFLVKKIVEREMAKLIEIRISLEALGAQRIFPKEDRSLIQSMTNLITTIEKHKQAMFENPESKADFDKDNKDLIATYLDFRLRVVKHKYLNKGEMLMTEADNYDAKSNAPQTFSEAVKAQETAVAYIEKNIDNQEGIELAGKNFEFAARRLLHIGRAVDELSKLENTAHEDYVLRNEKRFSKISKALKSSDLRDKSFEAQTTAMASAVRTIIKQKEKNALTIAELKSGQEASEDAPATPVVDNKHTQGVGPQRTLPELDGDAKLKRQVGDLTMQVESLKIEKAEMEKSVVNLQKKVKELQAALAGKAKNKTKAKAQAPAGAATNASKKAAPKSTSKPAVESKETKPADATSKDSSPAKKPANKTKKADTKKPDPKPKADSSSKSADKPVEEKAKQEAGQKTTESKDASNTKEAKKEAQKTDSKKSDTKSADTKSGETENSTTEKK